MLQLEHRRKRSHDITSGAKAIPIARALPACATPVEESLRTIRLRRAGQVAFVWSAGQPDDLGYGRARLIVRPVGIDEDKRSAGDVLDLN